VRFVRYYDKARMELPQPEADPTASWYVTNGLLVAELVRGQVQLGDDPNGGICPIGKGIPPCPSVHSRIRSACHAVIQRRHIRCDCYAHAGKVTSLT